MLNIPAWGKRPAEAAAMRGLEAAAAAIAAWLIMVFFTGDPVPPPATEAADEGVVSTPLPVTGVLPVRWYFMSSPEHWMTSMYRGFLPGTKAGMLW